MRFAILGLTLLIACGGDKQPTQLVAPPPPLPPPVVELDRSMVYVAHRSADIFHFHTFIGSNRWIRYVIGGAPMQMIRVETVDMALGAQPKDLAAATGTVLVRVGAWEYALVLSGESDFVGNRHGFDVPTGPWALTENIPIGGIKAVPQVTLTQQSIVSSRLSNTPTVRAERIYRISQDRLEMDVQLTWLVGTSVRLAYVAMCPLVRALGYPDRASLLGDDVVQEIGSAPFSVRRLDSPGVHYWTAGGDGFTVDYEILNPDEAMDGYRHNGVGKTWVSSDTVPAYNKFYATRIGVATPVAAGEVWPIKTRFAAQFK